MDGSKTPSGTRRCPRCRRNTFELTPKVAVLVPPAPSRRANDDGEERKQRLRYEPAWLCRNGECRHVELVNTQQA